MNTKDIKEILEMMEAYGIAEFELDKNGTRLKLSKSSSAPITIAPQAFTGPAMAHSMPMMQAAPQAGVAAQATEDPNLVVVRSPMVGTFYAAPAPDKPPYVQKNQDVKIDDVLCIVEAMKLMNEIKCEVSGKIVEVLVRNGESVEFDQPLFKVQKS